MPEIRIVLDKTTHEKLKAKAKADFRSLTNFITISLMKLANDDDITPSSIISSPSPSPSSSIESEPEKPKKPKLRELPPLPEERLQSQSQPSLKIKKIIYEEPDPSKQAIIEQKQAIEEEKYKQQVLRTNMQQEKVKAQQEKTLAQKEKAAQVQQAQQEKAQSQKEKAKSALVSHFHSQYRKIYGYDTPPALRRPSAMEYIIAKYPTTLKLDGYIDTLDTFYYDDLQNPNYELYLYQDQIEEYEQKLPISTYSSSDKYIYHQIKDYFLANDLFFEIYNIFQYPYWEGHEEKIDIFISKALQNLPEDIDYPHVFSLFAPPESSSI